MIVQAIRMVGQVYNIRKRVLLIHTKDHYSSLRFKVILKVRLICNSLTH